MSNRKKTEEFILSFLNDIEPTGYNVQVYKDIFAKMSDKDFDNYMRQIRTEEASLVIYRPMYEAKGLTVENNLKIAEKYGVKFFEPLIVTGTQDGLDYKTPIEYLVIDLPFRRQSQTLVKKISIPDDNKTIDELTYQPTGPSKGAKISFPELQVLIGMGLDESINEIFNYRGGDRGGFNAYNAMFMRYGSANMKTLSQYSSGVESTKTLKAYLMAMHVKTSL